MHPLSRPVKLIIGLCAVIIGLNVFMLLWLQTLTPTTRVASRQVDHTPIRVEPSPTLAPCEPTIAGNDGEIAERNAVIARLEEELESAKQAHDADTSAWRTRASQLEQDLMMLKKAANRVLEMDARHWQEGKIMLAHALLKEKT